MGKPSFLRRKLELLETEKKELKEETAELLAQKDEAVKVWGEKRNKLEEDFSRYKERENQILLDASTNGKVDFLKGLLPFYDDFETVMNRVEPEGDAETATFDRYKKMQGDVWKLCEELGLK